MLGYVRIEQAIFEVLEANAKAKEIMPTKRLVERMNDGRETIADLLDKMLPATRVKPATIAARRHQDKVIREALGHIKCADLTTKHVAELLGEIEARGKMQWAVHIRSRMKAVCRRGMALGWMDKNPADATERAKVLTDAHGILLALILTGANRNDVPQLLPLNEVIPPIRGKRGRPLSTPSMRIRPRQVPQAPTRRRHRHGNQPPGPPHGSGRGKTRWVVERTIAWLHNFKRLRVRFERLALIHEAFPLAASSSGAIS